MSKKPSHKNPSNDSLPGNLNQCFGEEDQPLVQEIWRRTGELEQDERPGELSREEIEQDLINVHRKIDFTTSLSSSETTAKVTRLKWLIAAVILLIAGAGYILIPKSATVPYGQIATLDLPDGSHVELNSGTQIRYNRLFSFTNRNVELNGEAFFSVADDPNLPPFTVQANGTTVRVTGTEFNIRSWKNDPGRTTEVFVTEGEVLFYPVDDPDRRVSIHPNQFSRWRVDMNMPAAPESVAVDRFLGWRDQMLIFNDKTLATIFRELERRFDVRIDLNGPRLQNETLTAYYTQPGSLESVLQDICRVKGLRFSETANGYRVYRGDSEQ